MLSKWRKMNFKQWLELDSGLYPAKEGDPEMNGLSRGLAYVKPLIGIKPSKDAKRNAKLFGKRIREADEKKDHDYGGCIFYTDGERVLLLKRSSYSETAPDKWGLPGGHSKGEETPLATGRRESKEEIGKVQGKRFGVLGENNKFPVYFFSVKMPFECKLSEEHSEWEWVRFEDLNKYNLHPILKRSIGKFVQYVRHEL